VRSIVDWHKACEPGTGKAGKQLQSKTCYLDRASDGQFTLRVKHTYWWQVITQLFCFADHPTYSVTKGVFAVWIDDGVSSGARHIGQHANMHLEFIEWGATEQAAWGRARAKIDKFYFNILLPELADPSPKGVRPRDMNQLSDNTDLPGYRVWPMTAATVLIADGEDSRPAGSGESSPKRART
jgi:hypothetical protein